MLQTRNMTMSTKSMKQRDDDDTVTTPDDESATMDRRYGCADVA